MRQAYPSFRLLALWHEEFRNYNLKSFQRDLLAGITVGAVALPLALAFGVASGGTAAAGLIATILAGIICASLGGASFQISGPSGTMSAVLISLAMRYGLPGVWMAGVLAGLMLISLGVFRLGRYVALIPRPVVVGFTAGVSLIIATSQLDYILGVQTAPASTTLNKLSQYFTQPITPDWHAIIIALIVIATMIIMPYITNAVPGSLAGLVIATIFSIVSGWDVPSIGNIPNTIILDDRLGFTNIPWHILPDLIAPAVAITALAAIETLLCGAVATNLTGKPIDNNQELIGQGIGNLIIPFFGGVPVTAALARTSVAVKSGGITRLVSITHSLVLLLSALLFGKVISQVPMAALGGVLIVTAWRMNEWDTLTFFVKRRLKHAMVGFAVTLIATVALDLTQAILLGIGISALIYLQQSASATNVIGEPVNIDKVRANGYSLKQACPDIYVYYLTGPLFFGSVSIVNEVIAGDPAYRTLIISARGVPMIDVMGAHALESLIKRQRARGGEILFCSLQPNTMRMFERTGLTEIIGEQNFYWSAAEAIAAAHNQHIDSDCPHCRNLPYIRQLQAGE